MRPLQISLTVCLMALLVPAFAEELHVLPGHGFDDPPGMMSRYLKKLADEAFERRAHEYEAAKTPEQLLQYQERRREFMINALGGFPDRTPLNPRVTGTLQRGAYTVEKIIFESQPGFHVTGLLYLPKGDGPHPAVLVPCGHSANGKASEAYQRACILLAMNGIAAFCYDPIGQGERYQLLDPSGKPRFGSTTEHTLVGVGSILLGRNTATYRIWDGIRAIDYLVSRPDIDGDRIGCTGNSGGGTLTAYIMALDPRVKVAAPSCYITSFERLVHTIGPQDAEQDIASQIAFGLDHADYAIMRAPLPTLLCAATHDFFDIAGTWDAFREAKRFYTRLGHPERISIVETDDQHGFNAELRAAMVQWMRRWLMGIDEPLVEPGFPVFTEDELQCTPQGQVLLMDGAHSIMDLNMVEEMRLGQRRHFDWLESPKNEQLAAVAAIAGIQSIDDMPYPGQEKINTFRRGGHLVEQYVLTPEEGIVLPVLVYVPHNPSGETHLIVHGHGKTAIDSAQAILAESGHVVVSVDLRGFGETAPSTNTRHPFDEYFGGGWREILLAYLLGKSYTGMRANDILAATRFIEHHVPEPFRESIILNAYGAATVPALHAAALAPEHYATVRLHDATITWTKVVSTPATKNQLVHAIHGALQHYDLVNLIQSLSPEQLRIVSRAPVGE